MIKLKKQHAFALESPYRDPVRRMLFGITRGPIERVLGLDALARLYERAAELHSSTGRDFLTTTLEAFEVDVDVGEEERQRIPKEGPVVVVANHPFGGIEGVVLLSILRSVRPDVKVLANYLLGRMPEMHPYCIYVDPFGSATAPARNLRPMKEAMKWLGEGHVLACFPSGEVSHMHLRRGQVCDPPWSPTIGRLVRRSKCDVVPLFFSGRNGNLFQLLGLVHPRCRTAMLAHEMRRRCKKTVSALIGRTIPFRRLSRFEDDATLTDYLRLRTYLLRGRSEELKRFRLRRPKPKKQERMEEILPEVATETIRGEVEALTADALLKENSEFAVYRAEARRIPNAMQEIGRLREITFRLEGEGTGKAIDLDRFDEYYHHLFLWHKEKQEICGAYRLAFADKVVRKYGNNGLYTSTLFRFRPKLWRELGSALELGRSFIRHEYQRNPSALLLLWKGIGEVVLRNPAYKGLFGPVSVNNEYRSMSRELMVAFLRLTKFDKDLGRLVRARHPIRTRMRRDPELVSLSRSAMDLDDISNVVGEIEQQERGVPILLKQYLRLNGRLIGFNIDPDFQDVLDGLIWVDLTEADERLLSKFLGKEGVRGFREYHGKA